MVRLDTPRRKKILGSFHTVWCARGYQVRLKNSAAHKSLATPKGTASIHSLTAHFPPFTPPDGYARVRLVRSFDELVATPFADEVNALCWPRSLTGDFAEVVRALGVGEALASVDETRLERLRLSAAGQAAAAILTEDLQRLRAHELSPVLDCIRDYPRDETPGPVPVDVYSFHADSAPVAADTWLCTYVGAPSEGLRNDEASRRVDVPATRAEFLDAFGGVDSADFRDYLREHCYDLHYAPAPHAQPFSFGVGNLWRIAVEYPGSPVPPCIHRAPATLPGESPRLLLIS